MKIGANNIVLFGPLFGRASASGAQFPVRYARSCQKQSSLVRRDFIPTTNLLFTCFLFALPLQPCLGCGSFPGEGSIRSQGHCHAGSGHSLRPTDRPGGYFGKAESFRMSHHHELLAEDNTNGDNSANVDNNHQAGLDLLRRCALEARSRYQALASSQVKPQQRRLQLQLELHQLGLIQQHLHQHFYPPPVGADYGFGPMAATTTPSFGRFPMSVTLTNVGRSAGLSTTAGVNMSSTGTPPCHSVGAAPPFPHHLTTPHMVKPPTPVVAIKGPFSSQMETQWKPKPQPTPIPSCQPPPLPPQTLSSSSSSSMTNYKPRLLQVVAELAPVMREQLLYVAVKIGRKQLTKPWGLGFAKHGVDRVLITKADMAWTNHKNDDGNNDYDAGNNSAVSWAHVVPVKDHVLLDPHVVYNENARKTNELKMAYAKRLKEAVQPLSWASKTKGDISPTNNSQSTQNAASSPGRGLEQQQRLLPGDLIMSVDGSSMLSFEGSCGNPAGVDTLHGLTSYLKSSTSACVVVLRMMSVELPDTATPTGTTSATAVQENTATLTGRVDPLQAVSQIRYAKWCRILPAPKTFPAIPLPRSGSIQMYRHCLLPKKAKLKPSPPRPPPPPPILYRNPWFKEELREKREKKDSQDAVGCGEKRKVSSQCIPYEDNFIDYTYEDGTRAALFMPRIDNFQDWISKRKETWRNRYTVHQIEANKVDDAENLCDPERESSTVAREFWTTQGFGSFEVWLETRLVRWKRSYSWNKQKRQRIQQQNEAVIHLPSGPTNGQFQLWLRVRRNQWRIQTRKRQRLLFITFKDGKMARETSDESSVSPASSIAAGSDSSSRKPAGTKAPPLASSPGKTLHVRSSEQEREMAYIDEILEAEELKKQKKTTHKPFNILKFFDSSQGMPDDAVAHFLGFLDPKEHGKVLAMDTSTSKALRERQNVWKQLCPSRWQLPRRPRKPWHELYLTNLRKEHAQHQKRWDDLLIKVTAVLERSDSIQKVEKMVQSGEKEFGFDVNYISSIVMERNSILNLAVILRRHKVVRWLVETKGADIETCDRGHFTPLANAAWAGDKSMVRYFLGKGSNRTMKSTQHSSQPIAPPDFEGLTPDAWAAKRGHEEIANLIRLGL